MTGKTGSRKTRRRTSEPFPSRRDALTLRIAVTERRRRQRRFDDDLDRDTLMMGWISKPVLDALRTPPNRNPNRGT